MPHWLLNALRDKEARGYLAKLRLCGRTICVQGPGQYKVKLPGILQTYQSR